MQHRFYWGPFLQKSPDDFEEGDFRLTIPKLVRYQVQLVTLLMIPA